MTNYEWLVKKGKLSDFLYDIMDRANGDDEGNIAKRIHLNYGMDIYDDLNSFYDIYFSDRIEEWLQSERPVSRFYFSGDIMTALEKANSKFQGASVVTAYKDEVIKELQKMNTKEIDE